MNTTLTATKRTLILLNTLILTLMANIDASIVNIALPNISKSFHVGINDVQWVVSSYLIAISAVILVWGRLADLHGRKRFFAAGLGIFTLGSLMCGLADNLPFLVAARVVQAVGASMGMALVQAIVTSIYPPEERGKALGYIGSTVAIGSLLGPGLGGLLVHFFAWPAIFFINVPIGIAGVILTLAVMPESPKQSGDFDWPGSLLFIGLVVLFFSWLLLWQEGLAPLWLMVAGPLLSVAALAVFLVIERKRKHPLIDETLFASKAFSLGVAASWFSYVAMFGYVLFMPFYLQNVLGLSAWQAGLLLSVYPLVLAVVAPLSGRYSDRVGVQLFTVGGLAATAVGLGLVATLGPTSPLIEVGLLIGLLGLGTALFQSPNNSSVMGAAPRHRLGIAGSVNSFFRNLGMVSGAAFAVAIFSVTTNTGTSGVAGITDKGLFMSGFRVVILAMGGAALGGALVSLVRNKKQLSR
ncbi:MAG: MFS transporter [Spirochaetales bacterium]|nr:MFS transporter [Spirochaetales bacterium]